MNTFLIIFLCFVILLMVGAGLFFMFGKKPSRGSDDTLISDESVLRTRSVIHGGKLSIEMDLNQEGLADVWNSRKTEEMLSAKFPSDIMRLMDKSTSKEEIDEIINRLRENGGYVIEEAGNHDGGGEEGKEELEGTEGEEPDGTETAVVDPLSGMQMPEDASEEQNGNGDKEEPKHEEVILDNNKGKIVFEETQEMKDEPKLRGKLIEFVIYLLTNYREGKLSAEHLAYVENRFHMTIEGDGWDEKKRKEALKKVGKYFQSHMYNDESFESIKAVSEKMVESFDEGKLNSESESGSEAGHKQANNSGGSKAQAPAASGSDEIVRRFFSRHGGKKDLIWERLGGQGGE